MGVRDPNAGGVPVEDLAAPGAADVPVEDLPRRYTLDALPPPATLGLQYTLRGLTVPTPPFVLLDTETSGLPHQGGKVVELGGVAVGADGALVSVFDSLVQCGDRSPTALEAFRVSGLDPWVLLGAPSRFDVWRQFLDWGRQLPFGDGTPWQIVAYNETFDRGMMTGTFEEAKTLPWAGRCLQQTCRDARPKGRKQFRLIEFAQSLRDIEGILAPTEATPGGRVVQVLNGAAQLHRALPDAVLSWRVWRVLWILAGRPARPKPTNDGPDPDIPF